MFVHGRPHEHMPFKENANLIASLVGCIRPKATYYNVNLYHNPHYYSCRSTEFLYCWSRCWIMAEQCHRNILKLLYNESYVKVAYLANSPINMCFICWNQFIISKKLIHARPFAIWRKMHEMIAIIILVARGNQNMTHYSHIIRILPRWDQSLNLFKVDSLDISHKKQHLNIHLTLYLDLKI